MTARSRGTAEDVDLLEGLWRRWARAGRDAPASVWERPGLGVWSVKELYAHVSRGATTTLDLTGRATDGAPGIPDGAGYFGLLMAKGVRPDEGVAELAKEWAARNSVTSLAEAFDSAAVPVLEAARRRPDRLLPTIAGTMRTLDYLVTRVVEATVHLLDFDAVVADAPTPPEEALTRTAVVLADLVAPDDFIRSATGRGPAVFPVLR
ncbi:maleylpyruvate isomerase N-terminal domain-containing protein [Amycolatopsis sp. WAC 04197]|uniref:maleylpyruvate isomerase N-terminal domain-containing protein n=1 Tax=Amycolatopsis sp. WAC 04197 TaxID=2203199 RepID=UPI0013155B5B|nr:maleylpyruvate isomerase N-terminal domain-containing protein [Amycolatopsis sp. WAC 04197]